jgi:hypothetical protein
VETQLRVGDRAFWVTQDGGATWQELPVALYDGEQVKDFAWDSLDPNVAWYETNQNHVDYIDLRAYGIRNA